MKILVIVGILILIIFVVWLVNAKASEEELNEISAITDVFRRIGHGDNIAITEEWEHLKKTKSKALICEAWGEVEDEFQAQGNEEAFNLLVYHI